MKTESKKDYLVCEQKIIYTLLMASAGMMGAYTYVLRGGVFCNAQTANVVVMAINFGKGDWLGGLYFLIPIFAYLLGAFVSEILPSPVKKLGFLRWDTYLIIFETVVLFLLGFIPLSVPHQVVQVMVNFIASMQYNTFRQSEGVPMATTFVTNHIRQVGVGLAHEAKSLYTGHKSDHKKLFAHSEILVSFLFGTTMGTVFCRLLLGKAIWITLLPLGFIFAALMHADLTTEKELKEKKPAGH